MPQTNLVQFTVRQGTDAQRKSALLQNGELGGTNEAGNYRLFIGDGATLGGFPVASKLYWVTSWSAASATVLPYVQIGDIVYNITAQALYALSSNPPTLSANYLQIAKNY